MPSRSLTSFAIALVTGTRTTAVGASRFPIVSWRDTRTVLAQKLVEVIDSLNEACALKHDVDSSMGVLEEARALKAHNLSLNSNSPNCSTVCVPSMPRKRRRFKP